MTRAWRGRTLLTVTASIDGRSTRYGASTPSQVVSGAASHATVTFILSTLQPRATYHLRAVETSAVGTVKGLDRSFRTPR